MEKERLAIDKPVTIAGVTLIPVARVWLNCQRVSNGISFCGTKQPVDIVLISSSARRAFRITGEEIPLDELIQEIPGIKDVVETTWLASG